MIDIWNKTYKSIETYRETMNVFIRELSNTINPNKLKSFHSLNNNWSKVTENLNELDEFITPVEPIKIEIPANATKIFIDKWIFWKEYLKEEKNITLKSRRENTQIKLLFEYANNEPLKAIELIERAINRGESYFYKLDESIKIKTSKNGNNKQQEAKESDY